MKTPWVSMSCLSDRSRRIERWATPPVARHPSESPADLGYTHVSAVIQGMLWPLASNSSKLLDFS